MSAYEIRVLDGGCRVENIETGLFVTQPISFAAASRKAAALNSPPPRDAWPFVGHRTMADVMQDEGIAPGQLPPAILHAERLGYSHCVEAMPIRGLDVWDWLRAGAGALIIAGLTIAALIVLP